MKKCLVLMAVLAIGGACGGNVPSDSKVRSNQNGFAPAPTPVSSGAVNSPTAPPSAPPRPTVGEKIEKNIELSFEPGGLPDDWRWFDSESTSNPTKYDLKSGVLKLDVPSGKDLYGEARTAPMLLKSVTGDFEIETKVKFDPKESYQGAGLLIYRNDSNYIRLERSYGGVGGGESGIRFDSREDEAYEPIATPEKFPTIATNVELRFTRTGKEFAGFWREPGGEWKLVGRFTGNYPETLQAGIIVCNTAAPIGVEFAYVKLGPVRPN